MSSEVVERDFSEIRALQEIGGIKVEHTHEFLLGTEVMPTGYELVCKWCGWVTTTEELKK